MINNNFINERKKMKRICLVSFTNIYVLPYAKLYIDKIINSGNSCSLLYWDRDLDGEKVDFYPECERFIYKKCVTGEDGKGKFKKGIGYFQAMTFFKKTIYKEKFDGLIFLETQSAVLCSNLILRNYVGKYIVDIRDFTIENIHFLKKIEDIVIAKSYTTVISSPAYKKFLPKADYVVSHNFTPFTEKELQIVRDRKKNNDGVIRISFIGTVRFIDMDKKILNIFKNDERFIINYYGRGSEKLKDYCYINDINNVNFINGFNPKDTSILYRDTDVINNLYGNNSPFLDYALSNKLYHAAQFYMPILVCKNTYMEQVSKQYNIGFTFDFDDINVKDRLYNWFYSLDRENLIDCSNRFIDKVKLENSLFDEKIQQYIAFIDK